MSVQDEKLTSTEQESFVEQVDSEKESIDTPSDDKRSDEKQPDKSVVGDILEEVLSDEKSWKAEAEALAAQIGDLKDQAVRAKAEVQNVRRRAEKDVEKAHKFALEKFSKELLPIIDGLEKAIEAEIASDNEMTVLREGVEMTLSMFLSGLKKFNLEQIDPIGHPFDPVLHEAMSMIDAPDSEPNTVIASMQKGYTLSGRLIRPAMVIVSKGSS